MFPDGQDPDRKPATKNEKALVWFLVLVFGGLMTVELVINYSPVKLGVPFFLLSWPVLLAIHEFGHAIMARLVGWHVELVAIGSGQPRFRRRIFGLQVEFRSIPLSGFALTRAGDLIQPRLKQFLIYAAGPGVELLLVLLISAQIGWEKMLTRTDSIPMIAVQSFCVAALLGAVVNLIPFPHRTEQGLAWSDGLGMLMSWRLPDEFFARQIGR
ncbi:MAG: M50 family metallopeptidase [Verrucomicrobiales bacterium]|nr:M50 family metallopeptidase [Verrucomicrobiales bacterium]